MPTRLESELIERKDGYIFSEENFLNLFDKFSRQDFSEHRKNKTSLRLKKRNKEASVQLIQKVKNENEDFQSLVYTMNILFPQLELEHKLQVILSFSKIRPSIGGIHFKEHVQSIFLDNSFINLLMPHKILLLRALVKMGWIDYNQVDREGLTQDSLTRRGYRNRTRGLHHARGRAGVFARCQPQRPEVHPLL